MFCKIFCSRRLVRSISWTANAMIDGNLILRIRESGTESTRAYRMITDSHGDHSGVQIAVICAVCDRAANCGRLENSAGTVLAHFFCPFKILFTVRNFATGRNCHPFAWKSDYREIYHRSEWKCQPRKRSRDTFGICSDQIRTRNVGAFSIGDRRASIDIFLANIV